MDQPFSPTLVLDIELSEPPGAQQRIDDRYGRVRALVRLLQRPLGMVELPVADGQLDRALLWATAERFFDTAITARCHEAGIPTTLASDLRDMLATVPRPYDNSNGLPFISVAISTRERPDALALTLRSLQACDYPDFEVVVVDNAPTTEQTRRLLDEQFGDDDRIRYVLEPRRGLSHGRNAALAACRSDLVAFTDDDVVVDRYWLKATVRAFVDDPRVVCVTGLVPTAELETLAQSYFDKKVTWGATRERARYTHDMVPKPQASFPYSAGHFGTGANFAVRREVIMHLGGFDTNLGAGSPCRGGEDLDIFLRVIRAGHTLVFEPASVVWHYHRVQPDLLRKQMFAYGLGFTAYATKCVIDPSIAPDIIRVFPRALKMLGAARVAEVGHKIPISLLAIEMLGMVCGPFVYLRTRAHNRRLARAEF